MEQIACKECTSPDCHGCNIFRLSRMLKDGKLDALMDENRGIKVEMQARSAVRGKWMHKEITVDLHVVGQCSVCKERRRIDNYCPNCGADMRKKSEHLNQGHGDAERY